MGNCNFIKVKHPYKQDDENFSKNHFILIYAIGKGGFGRVWKILRKGTKDEIYALKEISKVKVYEKNSIESIINERKLLANLRHPFLINIHCSFQDKDNLYLVLDYLSGGDLRYHITRTKKFTEDQTSNYFYNKTLNKKIEFFISCLILALEYLHSNNIMHRDVKPENLVFDDKGYLYLTDLGIAKFISGDKPIIDSSGTPGYMSPEVITNNPHDLTCDFYAVGIMVYEFMFTKRPFLGKSRKEIKEQMFSRDINIKASEVPPQWSIEAADFINKLLRKKSKDRLGKGGIHELKEHSWLRGIQWQDIYKKEVFTPFVPQEGENFDSGYCNKVDVVDKLKYDFYLNKINNGKLFKKYYFNYYLERDEVTYEQDNVTYKFKNLHEDGNSVSLSNNAKNSFTAMTTNMQKSEINLANLSQTFNMNFSSLSRRKLKKSLVNNL